MARLGTLAARAIHQPFTKAIFDILKQDVDYLAVAGADLAAVGAGNTLAITSEFHRVTLAATWTVDSISDVAGLVGGQRARLLFVNTGTIRNNGGGTGNIRTLTGASRPVAAGEVVELAYDATGAVWREARPTGMQTLGALAGVSGISFTSIPTDGRFKHLLLVARLRSVAVATQDGPLFRFNNDAVGPYDSIEVQGSGAAATVAEGLNLGFMSPTFIPAANAPANAYGDVVLFLLDYANAATRKSMLGLSGWKNTDGTGGFAMRSFWGEYRVAAAISRVDITGNGGVLNTGSMATLYGIPG